MPQGLNLGQIAKGNMEKSQFIFSKNEIANFFYCVESLLAAASDIKLNKIIFYMFLIESNI